MLMLAIKGTAKNAPIIPHIPDQNMSATSMTNQLKFNLSHIILGSIIFPDINCGTKRHTSKINGVKLLSNWTKLYKNGSDRAIIHPIAGIKSKRNTRSANMRAYSRPNIIIITTLTKALKSASENLERKNVFISS